MLPVAVPLDCAVILLKLDGGGPSFRPESEGNLEVAGGLFFADGAASGVEAGDLALFVDPFPVFAGHAPRSDEVVGYVIGTVLIDPVGILDDRLRIVGLAGDHIGTV